MTDRTGVLADMAPRTARTIAFAFPGLLFVIKTMGVAGDEPRLASRGRI